MNNKKLIILSLLTLSLSIPAAYALYGQRICDRAGFDCHKVRRGETWSNLFPDDSERNVVKRLNRMNVPLPVGKVIAIPEDLEYTSVMDISPFPNRARPSSGGVIKVDLGKLAWGAYDESGDLLRWGPASGGRDYCPDVGRGCRTIKGEFTVQGRKGGGYRSSAYPRPRGGAPMPYAMHFFKGYALHGSSTVPGYNASHGCVRLFTEDARWLNQEFVEPGRTKVIINR